MSEVSLPVKLRTALALGPRNILRAGIYRAGLRTGLAPVRRIVAPSLGGPYFTPQTVDSSGSPRQAWRERGAIFGWLPITWPAGAAPDWHRNAVTGESVAANPHRPWWEIPDFDARAGDVKLIWDLSRFDWVLAMAQRGAGGDRAEWDRLNHWLADWVAANPPYRGANWKCAQEASIRTMHLAMAALIAHQVEQPAPGLLRLVEAHLRRIAPTIGYAIAQDNNHGTSEAAALFIGGSWLSRHGVAEGPAWERAGRALLENRTRRLVQPDGTFSQYSVNYHRMLLDTLVMAESWRRQLDLPPFSAAWRARAAAATRWLLALVDPITGDAPVIGHNDGARLLPLDDSDFRDHRPSVERAAALFDVPSAPAASVAFDDGGFAVLRRGSARAVLRYPRFAFRPAQADLLHVDLWQAGENLLRDAGTFSYSTDPELLRYFSGTASHNTVQFDGRDQMPRIGRFLFGDWLATEEFSGILPAPAGDSCTAAYRDRRGARHRRTVTLDDGGLTVRDEISGFARAAVVRWRLRPGAWALDGFTATDGVHRIEIASTPAPARVAIVEGLESRYYMQKAAVPVLELEVRAAAAITTRYAWAR